jgi:hypothetical protein
MIYRTAGTTSLPIEIALLILGWGMLGTIIVRALTSERPCKHPVKQEPTGGQKRSPSGQNDPDSPSPDFAALIDTIIAEGQAYRKEEQKEDRGKTLREWLTIVLLGCTVVAIFWQVNEMIKVYDPIKDQAIAAKGQAQAALDQAAAAKIQADAAQASVQTAHETMIASQRAWVGPINAKIDIAPVAGSPLDVVVEYRNTGKEPALAVFQGIDSFTFTQAEDDSGITRSRIINFAVNCFDKQSSDGANVAYPASGSSEDQITITVPKETIDDAVVKGTKTVVILGCFAYETSGATHHSSFCFLFKAGKTKLQNLNYCPAGSHAD